MKHNPLADAPLTERNLRTLASSLKWLAAATLLAMSAFHLYTGTAGMFTWQVQRSVHLAFALGLAFLLFPAAKRADHRAGQMIDAALAALGIAAALYLTVNYESLARRAGDPTTLELWIAGVGLVVILEATRRSVSPALTFITLAFLVFAFVGHWQFFGEFGHRQLSLASVVNHQFYTDQGVFSIPLKVSSEFVFLFVLFGACLERSGAGRFLIDMAFATMGRFRGGPAKAAVMASGLMGTISGSSIANTVSTGSMTIPLMKKAGFKPHVAAAVEVAASTNGQLMPPVMGAAAFIMAEYTNIPYSTIVIAAFLPAMLSYIAIFTMIHLEAVKTGVLPGDPNELPGFLHTLKRGGHLLIPLVSVVVFLLVMRKTPNTSATLAIWVTLGLYVFVAMIAGAGAFGMEGAAGTSLPARIRHFSARTLMALRDGALNMVGIACACACCGIIIGVVTQTGLGGKLTDLVLSFSGGYLIPALLLTMFACLILGIGLPTTATYIIMASLTVNALISLVTEDPLNAPTSLILAAHLFVFYYGILADDTPPVGLCAYAASGIAGSDPIRTGLTSFRFDLAAFTLPLIFFLNRELLLIDFFPTPGATNVVYPWWRLLTVLPMAVVGMLSFAAALQGYAFSRLRWWGRVVFFVIALLLIDPDLIADAIGLTLLGAMYAHHRWTAKGRNTERAETQ